MYRAMGGGVAVPGRPAARRRRAGRLSRSGLGLYSSTEVKFQSQVVL